ncbi:MAG: sugar ABC transporter substrate-binding protein [Sphaerochaetaceae bacterium]|jgi:ribose transport system substrate-binding protein
MKRKIFVVFLVVLFCLTLPVFAKGAKEEKGPMRFAFSIMQLDNPYFIAVKQGFEDRCKELGVEAIIVDARYDVAKQVSDVENLIMQNVDGMMIAPIDQNALKPLVETAKAQGIAVVAEAQPIDNAHGMHIVNEYEYGVAIGTNAAKWINEKLGGKAEVIIISQDNVEPVIQRGNGIEDTILKLAPGSTIVARQAGDTPELGMKIVESVLQTHPNVKVITGNNDSGALGGYEAVKALGKATPDFYVGGGDATAEALAKMKEPNSVYRATVDILPYDTGAAVADMLYRFKTEGFPEEQEVVYFPMSPVWQEDVLSGKYGN